VSNSFVFPQDFTWGTATSSYQIEGAVEADGRGLSVWDMMCRRPGKIWSGHDGSVACDHYNRMEEDVALMEQLGLKAYRFSLAWPRIQPTGVGKPCETGLAFYDRLIDKLLEAGIEPWITLFHWDYPYDLYCRGGWLNPQSPQWFADYARIAVDRYSDRVSHWITLNEPQCFIGLGLNNGMHAPGDQLGDAEVAQAAHHAMIAHGLAVQVIREHAKLPSKVGWSTTGDIPMPASDTADDLAAARESWETNRMENFWCHTWWNDPVFLGHYPEHGLKILGKSAPRFTEAEMTTIQQPLDFFGTNNYRAMPVRRTEDGAFETLPDPQGAPLSHLNWTVESDLLYWASRWPYERYGKPVVFTENGFSGLDWVDLDGRVPDANRIDYVRRHLRGLHRAISEGIEVAGYFYWSLMDNFEWSEGYRSRFGLVHVDYATQKRTPKDSFHWYREVIATNGASLA